MDIKITKKRLVNMLNYEWIKMLIAIAAAIVIWNLIFTTTATRATIGETFHVVLYDNVSATGGDALFLGDLKEKGVLSYDVLESATDSIRGAGNYSSAYLLSVRMSTKEGDVIIADATVPETAEGEDPKPSNMQTVLDGYYLISLPKYFENAEKYLLINGFYDAEWNINEKKIEEYFRNDRILSARNYKKTYNTEEKISAAVPKEIARIKAIKDSLFRVRSAIESVKGTERDFVWYGERKTYSETGEVTATETDAYGIDLGKLNAGNEETKGKISDLWSLSSGGADGLVLGVFNFGAEQYDMQFEALSFIDYLIRTYGDGE